MSPGKIIGYIFSAIAIFFGVIFIWGAFSPEGQPAWIIVGVISVLIGFGVIWFVGKILAPGVKEVREIMDRATRLKAEGKENQLFDDKVNRIKKSQQHD